MSRIINSGVFQAYLAEQRDGMMREAVRLRFERERVIHGEYLVAKAARRDAAPKRTKPEESRI